MLREHRNKKIFIIFLPLNPHLELQKIKNLKHQCSNNKKILLNPKQIWLCKIKKMSLSIRKKKKLIVLVFLMLKKLILQQELII